MTHADALRELLSPEAKAHGLDGGDARLAELHVASCSECWELLALLAEVHTGTPARERERIRKLFGCDEVRQQLYLVATLDPEELRREHPEIPRHLRWCAPCRDRLLEFLAIERAARRGEFGTLKAAGESGDLAPLPGWRRVPTGVAAARRGIESLFELAGTIVVHVGKTVARLGTLPIGVVASGPDSPVPATRGASAGLRSAQLRIRLPPDPPLTCEIGFQIAGEARADVSVETSGREVAVRLRITSAGGELVASRTASSARPAVLRDVPADDYVLELETEGHVRHVPVSVRPE